MGQTEAFTRHCSGGGPNVSVGHVSVNEGGQAIVGNVTQSQHETASDEAAFHRRSSSTQK